MKRAVMFFLLVVMFVACRDKTVAPEFDSRIQVTGSIILQSEPSGAKIKNNGSLTYLSTPDTLTDLRAGIYTIGLVSTPGVLDTTFDVFLQEGEEAFYFIEMKRREVN